MVYHCLALIYERDKIGNLLVLRVYWNLQTSRIFSLSHNMTIHRLSLFIDAVSRNSIINKVNQIS